MNADLRDYVLTLPLDVRRELAKCDGPFWLVARYSTHDVHLLCREAGDATERDAYLPISPIAIALHAAKMSGRDGSHYVAVTICPCFSFEASWAELGGAQSPRDKDDVRVTRDDSVPDPTGHRAAIALLMKVMTNPPGIPDSSTMET